MVESSKLCCLLIRNTKPIAPIVTVTPQQAMGKALARGVIVDSGIKLLMICLIMN